MKKILTRKKLFLLAIIVAAVVAFLIACNRSQLHSATFSFKEWQNADEWKKKSLWLPDYEVVLEALPVEGVEDNLSGLTWNYDTQTLFAVVNRPPKIVELSVTGELLRSIDLDGFDDPEAIEYIGNNDYIVADERTQRVVKITIDADTLEIDAEMLQRLTLGMGTDDNKGVEGLAWDFAEKKLYAAKERDPIHIYEVTGFPQEPNATLNVVVESNRERDKNLFVTDVSSLDFVNEYRHLLVLSHESKLVLEVDMKGRPISSLPLVPGNGLSSAVPQAEGIATDDQRNLYLVSEPNLFYVFKKRVEE